MRTTGKEQSVAFFHVHECIKQEAVQHGLANGVGETGVHMQLLIAELLFVEQDACVAHPVDEIGRAPKRDDE